MPETPEPPSSGGKPARPVAPARRVPKIEVAPEALDDVGTELSSLVTGLFTDESIQVGVEVDEVSVRVAPDRVPAICARMKNEPSLAFDYLRCLSVVDYVDRLEVNYHLFSYPKRHKLVIKADLPAEAPVVPTVTGVWRTANWFEREGHDLFGVNFTGHPNMSPLLLYDGFEGHPGLKSYPFHDYDEW
jgi:NADH-quinone oxidoreductase subunit C